MSVVNETLIRDVVQEVLGRLGQTAPSTGAGNGRVAAAVPAEKPCGCTHRSSQGRFGVFAEGNDACEAAHEAFKQLQEKGVEARVKVVEIIKTLTDANAVEWGRIELEETKIGRLDHKIEKLKIIKLVPGVEWLHPDGRSGDHGIMLEEYTPFGVVAAITPSTHSIPTLSGNIVNIVAAGNAA